MKFPGLSLSIFALLAGPALGQDEAREPAPDEVSYEETQELIDRIQARIDRMEKSRAEADISMEFLTRQIEKAMAELLGKQSETAALREQAIGLSSEVQSLAVTRDELNSELARVTSEHDAVVAQLEVQTARLEAQVSGLAELLALEQQTTDQLRESLDEGTLELRATVEERDRLSRRLAETQDRSALTERELEARETRLGELLARAGVTERLLEQERLVSRSTQERIDLLNRQLRELRKQLAALNDALDASEVRNGKQQTAIVDLNQRLTRALALKVQELAKYRSEFFGRLREVLGERSDIRIVGAKGKSRTLRRSITAHLSLNRAVCSVSAYTALSGITNVLVANISVLSLKGQSATVVAWKSPSPAYVVSAWVILNWLFLLPIFGSSRACPAVSAYCSSSQHVILSA